MSIRIDHLLLIHVPVEKMTYGILPITVGIYPLNIMAEYHIYSVPDVWLRCVLMSGIDKAPTMTLIKEYLKSVENPKPKNGSGFVLPDGEFISLNRDVSISHEFVVREMRDAGVITKSLCYYGVVYITDMGTIAINANVRHITNKQLHTLAVHIIKIMKPNSYEHILFDMKHHPKSRQYHAKLQKLVGSQYDVWCVS